MFLAADVGGTKTLLALYEDKGRGVEPIKKEKVSSQHYKSLEELIKSFLEKTPVAIEAAAIGIAGPVMNGVVNTPNLPWRVEKKELEALFNTKRVYLINDLLATAYGIETLSEKDFFLINEGEKDLTGNRALLAAGTGLGEAGLLFLNHEYKPFASEGGHASFSCHQKEDSRLFEFLYHKYKGHVSTERVLSGQGLENLYQYVIEVEKVSAHEPLSKKTAQQISVGAQEKNCKASIRALELFIRLLGAESGDLALKFLATGGVYLGGGIAPKILGVFDKDLFFEAFIDKGRLKPLLKKIPVKIILNEETALKGAAQFLQKAQTTL